MAFLLLQTGDRLLIQIGDGLLLQADDAAAPGHFLLLLGVGT